MLLSETKCSYCQEVREAVTNFSNNSGRSQDQLKGKNAANLSLVLQISLVRHVLEGQYSTRELKTLLNLIVSVQRVKQLLQKDPVQRTESTAGLQE